MTEKDLIAGLNSISAKYGYGKNGNGEFSYGEWNAIERAKETINDYARLTTENAELKSSLTHANEECLKWHERAQNLLKDSGGSISGYEKKISDLQAKKAELRHRAEVAEKALLTACVNLIKNEEDGVNMELLAHVVYTKFLRKAEKELTEERKG